MLLERWGHNSGSLVVVLACAFALLWGFRRIVLASARVRAAVDDLARRNTLLPLGEGPAWRPALAGVAAGTLQAAMVIAVGAFFVMTAAPTVWDAADDYFPVHQPPPAAGDSARVDHVAASAHAQREAAGAAVDQAWSGQPASAAVAAVRHAGNRSQAHVATSLCSTCP